MTRLARPAQAAAELAVSVATIRRWLADGTLPGIRLGQLEVGE